MRKLMVVAFVLSLPLPAKLPLQGTVTVVTEHVDAGATSTIRINAAVGQLDIQGWDQPQVEVTVTKSVYEATKEEATHELNRVQVKLAAKDGGAELTTTLPSRFFILRPFHGRTDVDLQTVVHVPRGAHLVIRHENGDVRLRDLTGAIEASVHAGDLQLWMADAKQFQIDAQCSVGGVSSDFDGKYRGKFPTGDTFAEAAASQAPKALLRVGVGGIQILKAYR